MARIVLTRGIPASGKSTWAKAWVAESPESRIRLNRDEMRAMLAGRPAGRFTNAGEKRVTAMQHQTARDALKSGVDVVVDDTNLRARFVRDWQEVGPVEFRDFPISLEGALARNRTREPGVSEDVIRSFWGRYVGSNGGMLPPAPEPRVKPGPEAYAHDPDLPQAIIVDTDGTVARMVSREWFEFGKAGEDEPVADVVNAVRSFWDGGTSVIGVSGRSESCRDVTVQWWQDNSIPFDEFYMRAEGDRREDSIVKREIFDERIRGRFDVVGVFDDRDSVVAMWRSLGLTCFQVAPGNF